MELLTTSIITLIALYVIYSEPFKLPLIVKKNKKLSYGLIIGLYLYYHQNNIEPYSSKEHSFIMKLLFSGVAFFCFFFVSAIPALIITFIKFKRQDPLVEFDYSRYFHEMLRLISPFVITASIIYIWVG